jgi:hypothetical protein
MTSLVGQTVLVTGANRGMGREYIGQLLDRGVTKVYAAARDPRTIDATDPRVIPLQLDVTDATSVAEAGEAASDVSVLINNAGISRATSVLDPDTSNLREELETNLFGPLAMASTFVDRIAERSGAIVNVASILAWMPVGASYGVSKAAMWNATDSMRTPRRAGGGRLRGAGRHRHGQVHRLSKVRSCRRDPPGARRHRVRSRRGTRRRDDPRGACAAGQATSCAVRRHVASRLLKIGRKAVPAGTQLSPGRQFSQCLALGSTAGTLWSGGRQGFWSPSSKSGGTASSLRSGGLGGWG